MRERGLFMADQKAVCLGVELCMPRRDETINVVITSSIVGRAPGAAALC